MNTMKRSVHVVFQNLLLALVVGCPLIGQASEIGFADDIFFGGPVITMNPTQPSAEAVAVRDGLILAVGSKAQVFTFKGHDTQLHNLEGNALLPGFIDAHGHMNAVARVSQLANIAPPPIGDVTDFASLVYTMQAYLHDNKVPAGHWVVGFNYDDSLLNEKRHPTRDDIDKISRKHPVLILHASGHLGVVNSLALEKLGYNAATEDPEGGKIWRRAGSTEPSGVLEEAAFFKAAMSFPHPGPEQAIQGVVNVQKRYASYGITTAQEGAASFSDIELYRKAGEQGKLVIDIVAYPNTNSPEFSIEKLRASQATPTDEYRNHFRVGGLKMILDGSPQGRTAWLSSPYYHPPHGQAESYTGYPALPTETVNSRVAEYLENGWQVIAHANGDAAAEQFFDALDAAESPDRVRAIRPVMIHSQTARFDQLDRMATMGVLPSFFVAHTYFWGDWHRDVTLGPERATRISPAAAAGTRGIRYSFHNDSPVVTPDMMRLVWNGVARETRSGKVLGEDQRVSVMDALRAITLDAAYGYGEEASKGSIEPGKRADLITLAKNPLTIDVNELRSIPVVQTFKDGRLIYAR